MKESFKVRCVEVRELLGLPYTVGKTYEFENGRMIDDRGYKTPSYPVKNFKEWQRFSCAKWELIEDNPTMKEVKRTASVGEWIRFTKYNGEASLIGKIGVVLEVNGSEIYVEHEKAWECSPESKKGYETTWFEKKGSTEYVVLENYTPKSEQKTLSDYTSEELLAELLRREK